METGVDQTAMIHRLPPAPLVDRIEALGEVVRGRRAIHVGFVDSGFREMQERSGMWLHDHLAAEAESLVGIDIDPDGVSRARQAGYEAYVLDCCDPAALAEAGLEPAPVVVAGEVIEHLDSPGGFMEAAHELVSPGGELLITTPNAYSWLNVCAALARREVNHPDHVVMFTRRTLAALGARHGWEVAETQVYVPVVKPVRSGTLSVRAMATAARIVCAGERMAARLGRPYAAGGLIVRFRSVR